MHESVHCMTSDGGSQAESGTPSSSGGSPTEGLSGRHQNSSSSLSTRGTSSGSSDDSSMSSMGRAKLTLYETNIARQLLALKEGVPSDIITPRRQRQFIDDTRKDAAYWERRRKNNEAAKRSREKRRMNDMAMESTVGHVKNEMDALRNELLAIKRHYGLNPDQMFHEQSGEPISCMPHPEPVPPGNPETQIPHQPPPMMLNPEDGRVMLMPRLLRPMLHVPFRPSLPVMTPMHDSVMLQPPTPHMISMSTDEGHWGAPPMIPHAGTDLAYRQDDLVMERTGEYRSTEDSFHPSDENAYSVSDRCSDEQESPLNLVVKHDKPAKETSAQCSLRMHEEAARRYEEIKEGRVDSTNRDSVVISPGGSTSSTSSGSPYSKRLRIDESDSLIETESILSTSENTSSENKSTNWCAVDSKMADRRKRNNEASRRSRENRKHVAKTREEKTDVLEMENSKLRRELNSLASEVSNLKQMIVAKHNVGTDERSSVDNIEINQPTHV